MVVYYENSNGEKLNLLKAPFRTVEADWFDSDWDESADGYEKTISIDVFGNKAEFRKNMENLYRIIAVDAEKDTYGRLYVNGTFLRCRIKSSKKSNWKGYVYSEVDMIFLAPELVWVEEATKQFFPQNEPVDADGMAFPHDYPYDYSAMKKGVSNWEVDHIVQSDFLMRIYGPCVNPVVIINDHKYEVKTDLEHGEYLVIDSKNETVIKYKSNGFTENMFNERGYEYSIFEKIPSGMILINWGGDFGFDITLYMERREPKW